MGMVLGTMGGYMESVGYLREGSAKKRMAYRNAEVTDRAAVNARDRGAIEAQAAQRSISDVIARQRTAYAASGVDVGSETAVSVMADTRAMGELDVKMIQNNAAHEAWGLMSKAQIMRYEGNLASYLGKSRAFSTYMGTMGDSAMI